MKNPDFKEDSMLNAYIDGELDKAESRRLLVTMGKEPEMRERVCELQRTKEWVKFSFAELVAPTRLLPKDTPPASRIPLLRFASSMLVASVAFGAGWFGHSTREQSTIPATMEKPKAGAQHVVLHIGESNDARFGKLLDQAEELLQDYRDQGIQVEVIANAGGLDMLRTASSHHAERIKSMMEKYENVRFIACSNGLKRLRERGIEPVLIQGVTSHTTAGDHLIQRLQEGWTYIRI